MCELLFLLSYLVQHPGHLVLEVIAGVAAALLLGHHVSPPGLLGVGRCEQGLKIGVLHIFHIPCNSSPYLAVLVHGAVVGPCPSGSTWHTKVVTGGEEGTMKKAPSSPLWKGQM